VGVDPLVGAQAWAVAAALAAAGAGLVVLTRRPRSGGPQRDRSRWETPDPGRTA
jgi:hypothetical protein